MTHDDVHTAFDLGVVLHRGPLAAARSDENAVVRS
jgi:hypothetical protein